MTGQLDTRAAAKRARRLAERVEGVVAVVDHLRGSVDERGGRHGRSALLSGCRSVTPWDTAVSADERGDGIEGCGQRVDVRDSGGNGRWMPTRP